MSSLARNHTMGVRRSFAIAVCLLGMASLGTDCGTAHFRFEIGGNVNSRVVFRFLEGQGRDITIKEFIVLSTVDSHNPTEEIVWQLQGKARVQSIVYGEAPDGLSTKVGPVPLRREGRYSVAIHGEVSDLIRLRGAGSCEFTLGANGVVTGADGCRLLSGEDL